MSTPEQLRTSLSRPREGQSRPLETHSDTGLMPLVDQLGGTYGHAFHALLLTLGLPPSEQAVAMLDAFASDIKELFKLDRATAPWLEIYTELAHTLGGRQQQANSIRSIAGNPLTALLRDPVRGTQPDVVRRLKSLRAIVVAQHIHLGERLNKATLLALSSLIKTPGVLDWGSQPSIALRGLETLRQRLMPGSAEAKLLTRAIEFARIKSGAPWDVTTQTTAGLVNVTRREYEDGIEAEAEAEPSEPTAPARPWDYFGSLRGAIAQATPRKSSGVCTPHDMISPTELEHVFPSILALRYAGHLDASLAAMIALFFRLMPSHYDALPLASNGHAGVWLDINHGCLRWNLDELLVGNLPGTHVVRSPVDRYVSVPLPAELVEPLLERATCRPGATCLADLFGDLESLHRTTKTLLRNCSSFSHRPTLSRLSESWARYLLHLCRDEAYASALGLDFTVGVTAQFNYVTLRSERVIEVLQQAYSRVGLCGACKTPALISVGSLRRPEDEQVQGALMHHLSQTAEALTAIPRRQSLPELMARHNRIALGIFVLIKLCLGTRPNREEPLTRSRLWLDKGIAVYSDKRTNAYHSDRRLVFPRTVTMWISTYCAWLASLAYRVSKHDVSLAARLHGLGREGGMHHAMPLLFRFSADGVVIPLGSQDLEAAVAKWEMKSNAGRHWVDVVLRDAGLGSSEVQAWAGRGGYGQEPFGSRSSLIPLELLRQCSDAIGSRLGSFALPAPPRPLEPRKWEPTKRASQRYEPKRLQTRNEAVLDKGYERPPILPEDIAGMVLCQRIMEVWRNGSPPEGVLGVALSLILEDGVIAQAELLAALEELHHGTLYVFPLGACIDTRSETLGIRRVWLSPSTLQLAIQALAQRSHHSWRRGLSEFIAGWLKELGIVPGSDPLGQVLDATRAWLRNDLPASLAAWMEGLTFSRTLRPETVARQQFDCPEHPKELPGSSGLMGKRTQGDGDELDSALRDARQELTKGSADASVLKRLQSRLDVLLVTMETDAPEHLPTAYAHYLCSRLDNLLTLGRYLAEIREFTRMIASEVDSVDGLEAGDWIQQGTKFLEARRGADGTDVAPSQAALNHLFRLLGIDLQLQKRVGPPASVFHYAERPTDREFDEALEMLADLSQTPGDVADLARTSLLLRRHAPMRRDEVKHLRLCDVLLLLDLALLHVCKEAGGRLKSANAPRVLSLHDVEARKVLGRLLELRKGRFPGDPWVPLFGDDQDDRDRCQFELAEELICAALIQVSGSSWIRPHDTRRSYVDRHIQALETPANRDQDSLTLRQGLHALAVTVGHGDPHTTLDNYFSGRDQQRREWMDHLLKTKAPPRSISHLSGLTGIPSATYRSRMHRGKSLPDIQPIDAAEGALAQAFVGRVRYGKDMVLLDKARVGELAELASDDLVTRAALYLGRRSIQIPLEMSAALARLKGTELGKIEAALNKLNSRIPIPAPESQDRTTGFLLRLQQTRLPLAFKAMLAGDAIASLLLASAVTTLDGPWEFRAPKDLLLLAPLLPALREAGIATRACLRRSLDSTGLVEMQQALRSSGFGRIQIAKDRHFSSGIHGRVEFFETSTSSTNPNQSREAALMAALSLFSTLLCKEIPQ